MKKMRAERETSEFAYHSNCHREQAGRRPPIILQKIFDRRVWRLVA